MNANELADRLDKISYDCTIEEWRASPVGEAATKLRQQQESIEGLNRDYDLLFAEHQLLLKQEPVAMRYDYDGYGYQYIDLGSGSDWQTRVKGEPLYTTPKIEVGCAECGVNDNNHALYCVACAEKFVGEAATKLQQKQETIEGLNRDYDLLFAEYQLLLKNTKGQE